MKKHTSLLILMAVLFIPCLLMVSCSKNSSRGSDNPTADSSYVSSVVVVSKGTRVIDSIQYDSQHRIAEFLQFAYDSTSGSSQYGASTVVFSLPASGNPTGYAYSDVWNPAPDQHLLSYDGNGRILKDTSTSTGYVAYYSYPAGNVSTTVLWNGAFNYNQIDTLYMNNGNIGREMFWVKNPDDVSDTLQGIPQYYYTGLTNPVYHASLANSIGPLLFIMSVDGYGSFFDPLSQNVLSKIVVNEPGVPANYTLNYSAVLDNKGRVSVLTGSDGTAGGAILFHYY